MSDVHETDVPVRREPLHACHRAGGGCRSSGTTAHPTSGRPRRRCSPRPSGSGRGWVGYDRPGWGGSTPRPDRSVGSAAADVAAVVDALGIDRLAVMGRCGGGPHALACAALLPDRVLAAVSASGSAPYSSPGLDWSPGWPTRPHCGPRSQVAGPAGGLRGRARRGRVRFAHADERALQGEWGWLIEVVRPALANGPAPIVDDGLALVRPWGLDRPGSPSRRSSCTGAASG